MIKKENTFQNPHGFWAFAVITLLLLFCFTGMPSDKASAGTNTTDPVFLYDARGTESFVNIPTADESTSLPLCIPEVDKAPYFESVSLSTAAGPAEGICFTGHVKDDIRLKTLTIMIRTNEGYGFEIRYPNISGTRIDLSEYCVEGIEELKSLKQETYEVTLTAKDSFDQCVSKTFSISVPPRTELHQDIYGGQCVNYVREFFGGQRDLMPGLCIYADCGAYHAWEVWDLGFGKGRLPAKNSILILDKDPLLFGHVAVVVDYTQNADGTYTLIVNESNWDQDELIDCNVRYTYFPETSQIIREGRKKIYKVAGFIYSEKNDDSQTID